MVTVSQIITIVISLLVGSIVGIAENAVIGGFIQFFERFPCENIQSENWEQTCNLNKGISIFFLTIIPILSSIVTYWRVGRKLGVL